MPDYRILRHPAVRRDLFDIVDLVANYAGVETAHRKLVEIEATIALLAQTPHIGSIRGEIAPDPRAIPAGRKGVVCFVVDDDAREVRTVAIGYAGREWDLRARDRSG